MYEIKTHTFEGPLELMLDLIEKNKLSINGISLSQIADEYISYIRDMESFKREEVASFLVVAATLMLIKSRSLLPNLEVSEEEETDIQELERRLSLYKSMRELSRHIQTLQNQGLRMYARESQTDLPVIFYPPEHLTLEEMVQVVKSLIENLPQKEILPEKTIQTIVSLEERMDELRRKIEKGISESFTSLTEGKKEKIEIIVSFLAILELVKQGIVMIEQNKTFENITIKKHIPL